MPNGVLNKWLTEEESLWLQSRVYVRAHHFYNGWMQYFAAYSLGRLYWQADDEDFEEHFTLLQYDASGEGMFDELVSSTKGFMRNCHGGRWLSNPLARKRSRR